MTHNVSDSDRSHHQMFRQVLTAGGAKVNAANRWFDKTIQVRGAVHEIRHTLDSAAKQNKKLTIYKTTYYIVN